MFFSWFSYWLLSLFLGLVCLFFITSAQKKNKKFKRWGGVALVISFIGVTLFSVLEITPAIKILMGGSLAILFFGLWDDWKKMSWQKQLLFQIILILAVIFFGLSVDYISLSGENILRLDFGRINLFFQPIFIGSAGFIFLWYLIVINAVNWVDGLDGLMAGVAIVAALSVMMVGLRPEVNQPAMAILGLILIGGLLSFLWFNFPPAKIIAGTSGSYFVGLVLATLAIMAGTKIATILIILALPVVDFVWVIFSRIKKGKSIFVGEKNQRHFHYQLRRLGWSDRKIFLGYFFFLFIIFLLTVFLDNRQYKLWILVAEIIFIFVFIYRVNKKVEQG